VPTSDDGLWLAAPASTFPLSQTTVLALNRETADVVELAPLTAGILGRCHTVKPLPGHTAAAWLSGLSQSPTAVADAIDALASLGLLRPAQPSAAPAESASATIENVVIITCDRPDHLQRGLAAWRAHGGQLPRPHVVVVDGSRQAADQTRDVVAAGGPDDFPSTYAGATAARELKEALHSSGIPSHLLDAALTPGGIGSNRNIGLLLTAGEPILMQDDDVVAEPWMEGPDAPDGLTIGGHADLRTWRFFESRAEALSAAIPADVDLRAIHGRVLGSSLASLLGGRLDDVNFESACGHMAAAVAEADRRTVRVTFSGLAGDAARYCSHGVIFRPGPLRQRLWSDERAFRTAITSREVAVIAPGVIVTHDASCVGYCMGIDNRALVPPFMPAGRNEDGVWGATLAFMDPTALFAHVPVGVRHESDRPPTYEDVMPSARQSRIADLLLFVINRVARATFAVTPADRLRHLGALFTQAGSLSLAEFRLLAAEARLSMLTADIAQADAATKDPACPAWWREAVSEYERTFRKHVASPDFFLPAEFKGVGTTDDGFAAAQAFVRSFGEILTWWPEMWEAARRRRIGSTLTRDVLTRRVRHDL
jgi:hypothetical protein